jgi:hypothetical protein
VPEVIKSDERKNWKRWKNEVKEVL